MVFVLFGLFLDFRPPGLRVILRPDPHPFIPAEVGGRCVLYPPTPSTDGAHRLWDYPPEGSPPIGPPRGGPEPHVNPPITTLSDA